jgi:hypothetical protein
VLDVKREKKRKLEEENQELYTCQEKGISDSGAAHCSGSCSNAKRLFVCSFYVPAGAAVQGF